MSQCIGTKMTGWNLKNGFLFVVLTLVFIVKVKGQDPDPPPTPSPSPPPSPATSPPPGPATPEEPPVVKELRLEFNSLKKALRKDDCAKTLTKTTLEFLSLMENDLHTTKKTNIERFDVDCSLRLTQLHPLRRYLKAKGFFRDPGSLHLINAQDTTLRLICGDDVKGLEDARWRAQGLTGTHKDLVAEGGKLTAVSPDESQYFRKYTCASKKGKCAHTFYVITRPQPIVNFPLQHAEGDENVVIKCHMDPCQYTNECNKDNPARPQPLYQFLWTIPNPEKNFKGPVKDIQTFLEPCKIRNYDKDKDSIEKPVYISFKPNPKDNNTPVADPAVEGFNIELKVFKNGLTNDFGEKFPTVIVQSEITIKKAKTDVHAGEYECIIIDGNGVPSVPNATSLSKNIRFSGRAVLHVRGVIWTIIPAALIIGILVIMIVIHFVCPPKMEHDDGTLYTRDEIVSPQSQNDNQDGSKEEQGASPAADAPPK